VAAAWDSEVFAGVAVTGGDVDDEHPSTLIVSRSGRVPAKGASKG
jgi:hypothetical protein